MAVWRKLILDNDLPQPFTTNVSGLVPAPGSSGGRQLVLHSDGTWRNPNQSVLSSGRSFTLQGIESAPQYTDAEIGRHLSFVKGLSIASYTADGTNVTVNLNSEHGLIQSDLSSGATITISGCSNSAYNGTKTPNALPSATSIRFAETNTTSVTVVGYMTTSGASVTKDAYMLHWASDIGLADHSVAFSKLPELNAMKVIGNTTGGSADATEVSIELTPTSASTNLITSGAVYAAVNSIQDSKIASASVWNGKQDALTFGIAQNNTVKVSSAVVDNSSGVIFPKFTATGLTARSAADFKTDLSLAKADVGLGNVDNTSDASKPISTATQSALDAKQATLTFGKSSGNSLKSEEALTTDDVLLMGTNNVKGRTIAEFKTDLSMHVIKDIKTSGFFSNSSSKQYIPINGTLNEATGLSYGNDSLVFIAPFDGSLEQVVARATGVPGSTTIGLHKTGDSIENPNPTATGTVTVNMSVDDTAYKFDFTTNNTFSAGDVIAVSFDPTASTSGDVNITMVFSYDTTQGV